VRFAKRMAPYSRTVRGTVELADPRRSSIRRYDAPRVLKARRPLCDIARSAHGDVRDARAADARPGDARRALVGDDPARLTGPGERRGLACGRLRIANQPGVEVAAGPEEDAGASLGLYPLLANAGCGGTRGDAGQSFVAGLAIAAHAADLGKRNAREGSRRARKGRRANSLGARCPRLRRGLARAASSVDRKGAVARLALRIDGAGRAIGLWTDGRLAWRRNVLVVNIVAACPVRDRCGACRGARER
jgi:hypothetical protein